MLGVLLAVVGTEPFVTAARSVRPEPLVAASLLALLTTACAAWRWHLVAGGLGLEVPPGRAVAAYYRSQFLNLTLPGGVLGDVHRGVRHGRRHRAIQLGLRAVVWERAAGQGVQLVLTVVAVLVVPTALRPLGFWALLAAVVLVCVTITVWRGIDRDGFRGRVRRAILSDVRAGLLAPSIWAGVVATSVLVVAGHLTTFWLAARVVGVRTDPGTVAVVGLCVLGAAAVPANVAGWGPREGMAAWAFGVVGVDPGQGVAVSAVYGMMALVAVLPGAVVLAATRAAAPAPSPDLAVQLAVLNPGQQPGSGREAATLRG